MACSNELSLAPRKGFLGSQRGGGSTLLTTALVRDNESGGNCDSGSSAFYQLCGTNPSHCKWDPFWTVPSRGKYLQFSDQHQIYDVMESIFFGDLNAYFSTRFQPILCTFLKASFKRKRSFFLFFPPLSFPFLSFPFLSFPFLFFYFYFFFDFFEVANMRFEDIITTTRNYPSKVIQYSKENANVCGNKKLIPKK